MVLDHLRLIVCRLCWRSSITELRLLATCSTTNNKAKSRRCSISMIDLLQQYLVSGSGIGTGPPTRRQVRIVLLHKVLMITVSLLFVTLSRTVARLTVLNSTASPRCRRHCSMLMLPELLCVRAPGNELLKSRKHRPLCGYSERELNASRDELAAQAGCAYVAAPLVQHRKAPRYIRQTLHRKVPAPLTAAEVDPTWACRLEAMLTAQPGSLAAALIMGVSDQERRDQSTPPGVYNKTMLGQQEEQSADIGNGATDSRSHALLSTSQGSGCSSCMRASSSSTSTHSATTTPLDDPAAKTRLPTPVHMRRHSRLAPQRKIHVRQAWR